jgi:hypothetical protein
VTIAGDRKEGGARVVSLSLHGSSQTGAMSLRIPKEAKLENIRIRGENVAVPKEWSGSTLLNCDGPDCRDLAVTLTLGNTGAVVIPVAERRYGLPPFGAALAAARPATAMPSQSGDGTILATSVALPAR